MMLSARLLVWIVLVARPSHGAHHVDQAPPEAAHHMAVTSDAAVHPFVAQPPAQMRREPAGVGAAAATEPASGSDAGGGGDPAQPLSALVQQPYQVATPYGYQNYPSAPSSYPAAQPSYAPASQGARNIYQAEQEVNKFTAVTMAAESQAGVLPSDPYNDGSTNVIEDKDNTTEREDILLYIVIAVVVIAAVYGFRQYQLEQEAKEKAAKAGQDSAPPTGASR